MVQETGGLSVSVAGRALVVGVDCSTTACKAIAWDRQGQAVAEGRAAIALDNPEPDGWEQDARSWWDALGRSCRQLLLGLAPDDSLEALCVTHQRETFVVCDDNAEPLHPALVWMDARCREQVKAARRELGEERLHRLSGKPASTTPSFYKLAYLLDREPALRAGRVLDVHGYLVWQLTGRFCTSLAAADPMGLVDMQARCWAEPLLAWLGLAAAQLPELVLPGTRIGGVSARAAAHTGLPLGLPVVAGAGDGQAAGLGAGVVGAKVAYLNLGTAIVSGVLSPSYLCDRAFRTLYAADAEGFFLETDLQGGTFMINWWLDRMLFDGRAVSAAERTAMLSRLEHEAEAIAPGSEGLVVVPYWNGVMNPYWDDEAAGIMLGWRGHHRPAHVYRAMLEGIAFEQRLHTSGVESVSGRIEEWVVLGGGSRSDLWCQLLADVLGRPLIRAGQSEATALGAGMLAALQLGWFADAAEASVAMTSRGRRFEPGPAQARYDQLYQRYRGIYPALRDRG